MYTSSGGTTSKEVGIISSHDDHFLTDSTSSQSIPLVVVLAAHCVPISQQVLSGQQATTGNAVAAKP